MGSNSFTKFPRFYAMKGYELVRKFGRNMKNCFYGIC